MLKTKQVQLSSLFENLQPFVWITIIGFSIYSFILNGVFGTDYYHDYYAWYAAGEMWLDRVNLYDYRLFHQYLLDLGAPPDPASGFHYPPFLALIASPLVSLPLDTGYLLFTILQIIGLIGMLFLLGLLIRRFRPVRLPELALLTSLLNTNFARTSMRLSQISLFFGALIFAAYLLYRVKKPILAGFTLSLLFLKTLFLPLFELFFLLKRDIKLVFTSILGVLLLVLIPQTITGEPVLPVYLQMFQGAQEIGFLGINDPSPQLLHNHLQNLAPLIYRIFGEWSPLSDLVATGILLVLTILVAYLVYRAPQDERSELLAFALVSSLSLLVVYRRLYDTFLLFPGILFLYLEAGAATSAHRKWAYYLLAAGLIAAITLPGDLLIRLSFIYPQLSENYWFLLLAPYQAWINVLLFGLLLQHAIRVYLKRPAVLISKPFTLSSAVERKSHLQSQSSIQNGRK